MADIERQLVLGFIQVHILYHASVEPVYGVWLMSELERHGYRLSPGTLYPILHGMEEEGYLSSERKTVNGKVRRYYRATEEGRRALERAKERARELVGEILIGDDGRKEIGGP
jgi:DNA-binding PadR family transcriptional regulator